jgi:hypothetical protein
MRPSETRGERRDLEHPLDPDQRVNVCMGMYASSPSSTESRAYKVLREFFADIYCRLTSPA